MQTGYNNLILKDPRLARNISQDDKHIRKYPLRAAAREYKPAPVITGINWYDDFYQPTLKDGRYWIGLNPHSLGMIRGGHCVVIPQDPLKDAKSWYRFYNQLREGACVGAGTSRAMSHLNRKQYKFRWLWEEAKAIDEWDDTNRGDNEGTSVRAACDVLRTVGHVSQRKRKDIPSVEDGIIENRWAITPEEILIATGNPLYRQLDAVPIHNSWGEDYPHTVWIPLETIYRLQREDGEFAVIRDYEKSPSLLPNP